jgi:hypothetical protein
LEQESGLLDLNVDDEEELGSKAGSTEFRNAADGRVFYTY